MRMAKKKTEIQELSEFIRDHMATKEDLADIRYDMATKDDVRSIIRAEVPAIVRAIVGEIVDEKLKPISDELTSIRRDLEELNRKVENSAGLTKEIDHALERIAAIEKHLGISQKIAA